MSVIQKPVTRFAPQHSLKTPSTHLKKFSRTDNLTLWYNVTLRTVRRNEPDLTTRQLALFMRVYLEPGPHTVRSLALELGVTKAVISRALNRLCKYNFIQRADDPDDGRSVLIKRTPAGIQYLQRFGDMIHQEMPDGARLLNWH